MRRKSVFIGLVLGIGLLGVSVYVWRLYRVRVENWENTIPVFENAQVYDQGIKTAFLDTVSYSSRERFNGLFQYFLRGYLKYRSKEGALVYYPGEFSGGGQAINALEGFARFFPLACSYMHNAQNAFVQIDGRSIDLSKIMKTALLSGTNPGSKEYWGVIKDRDQKIAEAADIALGLWVSREYIWNQFSTQEKKQIYDWLIQVESRKHGDNNWNLFPVMVIKSLEALSMADNRAVRAANKKFGRYIEQDYLGDGWFKDGEAPPDYYNAWAIHYCLFWLNQMHPGFHSEFICEANKRFASFFKYFFGPKGFPMMGRSVCYRMALPSPLVAASLINGEVLSEGEALRALETTWAHFIENDALEGGKVTQGFYQEDLSILNGYSGAGSCLWSLRSLILAFYVDAEIGLFDVPPAKLPVEIADFEVHNPVINWTIRGDKESGDIMLELLNNDKDAHYQLDKYDVLDAFLETLWQYPHRPNNKKALYKNRLYSNENLIFTE